MASSSQPNGPIGQLTDDLLATQKLLRATLDASIDMIQVFEAVRNQQGEIVDFIWLLNNHASEKFYGDVVGKNLLELQPGVMEEGIFTAFKQVVETGEPQQYEKHYVHEQFDGWFHQSVVKLNDGVATTTANITPRKQAQEQLQQSQAFLQSVIDSSLDVIQVFKAVRDETGAIRDFVWVMNNHKAVVQNGDVISKSLLERNPGVVPTGIFDHMVEVAQTGIAYEHEQYYQHEQFDGWFYQALVKTDDGVAMTTRDISRQKQAEQEVLRLKDEVAQKATDKYRILFETMDEGFCVQELLFDQHGEVADLIYREANQAFARHTGLADPNGKRASEVFPHIEQGWFDVLKRVYQTGVGERTEGFNTDTQRWLTAHYSPVGGAGSPFIAAVFQDITERKRREQQQDYLLRLNDALRPMADPLAIQRAAMRVLGEYLGVDRAIYAEINLDEDWFEATDNYTSQSVQPVTGRFPFKAFGPPGEILKKGESLVIEEVSREVDEDSQQAFYSIDVLAVVAVPLIKNGKLVADLSVHQTTPRHWLDHEVALLQETAERTWAAVERAKAEAALRESEKRLRLAIEATELATWEWDLLGDQVYWNEQHFHLLGLALQPNPLPAQVFMSHLYADDAASIQDQLTQAIANRTLFDAEFRMVREDGVVRWMSGYGRVTGEQDHKPILASGVMFDITDRKHAELALQEADRRKDEFLAMLAHELRNPLAPIRNGLQLLDQTHTDDQLMSTLLPIMNRQMDHIMRMMDDLLDVSRISRGKIELHKQPIDLTQVVSQTLQAMQPLYTASGKQLNAQLPNYPIYLDGDATRLNQVVANLLTNGLRYTRQGGQVWLSLEQLGEQALVRVRDNGIGLAADQLDAIFELFVQVDTNLARSNGGLGLGLALVQQLVQLHGGRVEAHSPGLEQGSEFVVYLPIQTQ